MKLLMTRLAGGLLGRSGSGYGMINRRSCFVDLVPTRRHMVTTVTRRMELESTGQAPDPAAADDSGILTGWKCYSDSTAANVVPDDRTAAESHTSWGRPLRVCLGQGPPASSFLGNNPCDGPSSEDSDSDDEQDQSSGDDGCHEPSSDDKQSSAYDDDILHVVASHGDSVLLKMPVPCKLRDRPGITVTDAAADYFLYKAAAAGKPPSLTLLPACHIAMHDHEGETGPYDFFHADRVFDMMDTGVLRCGGDEDGDHEVLVAQLQVTHKPPFDTAEICVLRPGRRDWELKAAVPIVHDKAGEGLGRHDLGRWLELNGAIPAGNRFLCWVNYARSTMLVYDMVDEENPMLRYVPLPVKPAVPDEDESGDDEHVKMLFPWQYYQNIRASTMRAAAPVVRFVSIDNRCCRAPWRASVCEHSRSSFVVSTWTMDLNRTGEPLEWVKEGALDCEEIRAALLAAGYGDIPRVHVKVPIVISKDPDFFGFLAQDIDSGTNGNMKSWMLLVDMRSKTQISVFSFLQQPHGRHNRILSGLRRCSSQQFILLQQ